MRTCFACILVFFLCSNALAQTKHALLIGIGNYNTKLSGWNKLNSVTDIEVVKKTLERQMFLPANIHVVVDGEATKTGIINAIKELTAKVNSNSGDVVYIHISSHGVQLEDDNNDETDALDEAIVPIDARVPQNLDEYKSVQAAYLRDDEFGELIEQLRAKIGSGGDVAVLMDLCHSGTATRGELVARGNKPPIISRAFRKPGTHLDNLKEFRENAKASRGDNNNLSTYVVFAAARADEAAYETVNDENEKMGVLSYAFCKAVESLNDTTSYRTLFAKIAAIMDVKSNIQHPVMEGNGIDRGFLGGNIIIQKPYVEVESIDTERKLIKIRQGLFSGIDEGSFISFYPSGTTDPVKTTAIAKGRVAKANQFSAEVLVEQNTGLQPKDLYAFVTEPVFNIRPIILKLNEGSNNLKAGYKVFTKQEAAKIRTQLKPLKQIIVRNENPDIVLVKGQKFDSLIIANNGALFGTTEKKTLEESLKLYSRYKFLKELEVKDNTFNVEIKLGKLKNGKADFAKPAKTVKGYEYAVGDVMIIAAKNNGKQDIYVNILDFQPDGKINPVFPSKGIARPIQPFELKIPAGEEIVFKDYQIKIYPPLGSEILKVFISDKEIDVEGLADGFRGNNLKTALEKFVSGSSDIITRGADVLNLSDARGISFNIPFQIKGK